METVRRIKPTLNFYIINVKTDFRTQRVLFRSDMFESLPTNQGALQGGVISLVYYILFEAHNDSLCITGNRFSFFAFDTNVLFAAFICPISGQLVDNGQR